MIIKYVAPFTAAIVATVGSVSVLAQDKNALMDRAAAEIDASENASPSVKAFIKNTLLPICTNRVFVREVKAQNAKSITLAEIQRIDEEWKAAEEELPIMTEKLENTCAQEIKRIASGIPAIVEAFVMDDKGAIVGENNLTSDYWQGDEPKWINSYRGGQGGVHIGEEKFDRSANTVLQQISLPIIDTDGSVVGAVTFGISTNAL